jgi:hypothetical protein
MQYCSPKLDISNEILCAPNGYCMQTFCPWKVDVETNAQKYLLAFQKHLLVLFLLGLGFCTFTVLDLC